MISNGEREYDCVIELRLWLVSDAADTLSRKSAYALKSNTYIILNCGFRVSESASVRRLSPWH